MSPRVLLLVLVSLLVLGVAGPSGAWTEARDDRPNILWIVVEDQSRHYGCYGEPLVKTPTIDGLARRGLRFSNASVTAPVCSTARSALITGMFQTSVGAHHHRSGRGAEKIHLPEHVKLIPEYFRAAGYYTTLGSFKHVIPAKRKARGLGKSDYNFEWDTTVYDASEWSGRKPGQPFFAQVTLAGGKARGAARKSKAIPHVAVSDVRLPPYYPRHPVVVEDWAAYLDTFSLTDTEVQRVLERLRREGELERTVVFFLTDHGVSHARGKQFCYDEGMQVPLIVHGPGVPGGMVRDDPVLHIDIAASSLALAGIEIPKHLEGRDLFAKSFRPREHVVCARDRCDETYDRIRAVRTKRFKYIRNGYPRRPQLQPCAYKDAKPIYQALREWHAKGKLDDVQRKLLFAPERPAEELYDLAADPWELRNLAGMKEHASSLADMRRRLDAWISSTGDRGQAVEASALYDSDMRVYLDTIRRRNPARVAIIEANIAQMKRWWSEGK